MHDISNISHSPNDLSRGTFCVQLVQLYFLTYALTLIKDVLAKVVIDQAGNRMMLPSVFRIAISTYLCFLSFDVVSYNARDWNLFLFYCLSSLETKLAKHSFVERLSQHVYPECLKQAIREITQENLQDFIFSPFNLILIQPSPFPSSSGCQPLTCVFFCFRFLGL